MKLIFGDLLPDLPDYGSPGVREAVNVYPSLTGYRPVGAWGAHTDALPAPCRGASAFIAPSGRLVILAGTQGSLYRLDGLTWVQIATDYSLTEGTRWRFAQFGEIVIASNEVDFPVKVNIENDVVSALGGGAPKMQAMAVVNNFLVGTQINGAVSTVGWSGENNAEWWTFAQRKSDYQEFADGGEITGIIGGEVGLILQRNAIRRMAYVGGNVLFRFDKISSNVGCSTIHSVAQHGELAFWLSEGGFKMWDGAQIKSIGFEKVDNAFNRLYGLINYNEMSATVDGPRNTVIWSTGRKLWLYNWILDKWSVIDHPAEIIAARETRAPGLEEQDPEEGSDDEDVDAPLDSFDAARFVSGDPTFYAFTDGVMGTFNGENLRAKIVGRDLELIEGRDARIRRVRPMTDALAGITVRLETRQKLGVAPTRKDFTDLQTSGEMPVRSRGRYARATLAIAAGQEWTHVQGLDATLETGGRR